MKVTQEQNGKKAYHRPEVKDYGNIRQLTAGAHGTGGIRDRGFANKS
jgi:hypothetical protein